MDITTQVDFAPAIVVPNGKTTLARRLDIVQTCDHRVLAANVGMKGKVGVAIRERFGASNLLSLVEAAACNDYRPFAEHAALHLGEAVVISGRSSWEAFGDTLRSKMLSLESRGKDYREDKNGTMVMTVAYRTLVDLHKFHEAAVRTVNEYHEERKARKAREAAEREATEQAQLANEQAAEQPAAV